MNEGLIPARYAKALYKFALEKGADKGLYRLMGNLGKSFVDNPTLDTTVANPFVADSDKTALLTTAAAADADTPAPVKQVLADFLKLLCENRRLPLAGAIARAYCELYRKENRIYRVKIVSAMPLDNEEEQRLKKLISSHLGDASMEYTYSTDPDLIGGFTVDIDNERLDASVKNELKQFRLKLLKQG